MIRKYGKFTPINNRPNLPLSDNPRSAIAGDVHDMFQFHYVGIAWAAYWKMVHQTSKKHKLSLWAAHQKLQKDHPFPVPVMGERDYVWREDDFLILFMLQFEKWQTKTYDMDKIYDEHNETKHIIQSVRNQRADLINAQTSLEDAFELYSDDLRSDMVCQSWCRKHKHILEQIGDDPIFGHNAKYELMSLARSEQFAIDELFRRSALPENVMKIDEIIKHASPTNYAVFYPYVANQFHSVPNCLCVMGDGSPMFRLEVLDPATCCRFKLAELMNPWWGENSGLLDRLGIGEGEYDFPFYDFNLHEGDEFDINKLLEVMQRGVEQINTRSKRKWGVE